MNADDAALAELTTTIGTIGVALLHLDVASEMLAAYQSHLGPEESARAARFRHDRDRDRFVARRGQLRERLARELDQDPGRLRIETDPHGKPFLPDCPELGFNLSHSHALALCVIGRGLALGCDIERRDREFACRRVADRLFAPSERAALAALPDALWAEGFFNCWTRKEAYVKALGLGLSYPLDAFTVSVAPGEPARLIEARPGWSLMSFEPAPGYQAALVAGDASCSAIS